MACSYHPPWLFRSRLWSLLAVFGFVVAGCAEGSQPAIPRCESDDDCTSGVCESGSCVAAPEDVAAVDAGSDFAIDAMGSDAGSDAQQDADGSIFAGFGEACVDDSDCVSGYCIDSDDGRICTRACNDDCPEGYSCRLITTDGPDAVRLCIPESEILCRPCTNDTQCGSFQNFCLDQDNGTFCAIDCSQTRACPDGYGCDPNTFTGEGPDGGDLETWLCEPLNALCHPITMIGGDFQPAACMLDSPSYTMTGFITSSSRELTSPTFRLLGGF